MLLLAIARYTSFVLVPAFLQIDFRVVNDDSFRVSCSEKTFNCILSHSKAVVMQFVYISSQFYVLKCYFRFLGRSYGCTFETGTVKVIRRPGQSVAKQPPKRGPGPRLPKNTSRDLNRKSDLESEDFIRNL